MVARACGRRVERLGDDLGLVAVDDDAGGELLRNGERVEHQGSLPSGRSGRNRPRRPVDSRLAMVR